MTPLNLDPNKNYLATAGKPIDIPEWRKSLSSFGKETDALGSGLKALGAQAFGMDETRDEALGDYQRKMDEASSGWRTPEVGQIEDIKFTEDGGVGRLGAYLGHVVPKGIAQLGSLVVGGLGTGAVVKGLASKGIKDLAKTHVKDMALRKANKEVRTSLVAQADGKKAAEQLAKRQIRGASAGVVAGGFGMEAGQTYGKFANDPEIGPEKAVGPALAYGSVASVLEFLPIAAGAKAIGLDRMLLRKLIKETPELAKKAIDLSLKRKALKVTGKVGGAAVTGGLTEGVTEGMQSLAQLAAERYAKEDPEWASIVPRTPEEWSGFWNEAVAGAATGFFAGAAAGPFTGTPQAEPPPPELQPEPVATQEPATQPIQEPIVPDAQAPLTPAQTPATPPVDLNPEVPIVDAPQTDPEAQPETTQEPVPEAVIPETAEEMQPQDVVDAIKARRGDVVVDTTSPQEASQETTEAAPNQEGLSWANDEDRWEMLAPFVESGQLTEGDATTLLSQDAAPDFLSTTQPEEVSDALPVQENPEATPEVPGAAPSPTQGARQTKAKQAAPVEVPVEVIRKADGTAFKDSKTATARMNQMWNKGELEIQKGKEAGKQARARVVQEGDGFVIEKLESRNLDEDSVPDTDSTGQLVHPTPEGRANFKKWFEGSEVVDEKGQPIVAYHGGYTDITKFGSDRPAFFTSSPAAAESYAIGTDSATVTPSYLAFKNPLVIDYGGQEWFGNKAVIEQAQQSNYDGVIFQNVIDPGNNRNNPAALEPATVYVALKPTQVKSAIGNQGTFEQGNPNILESRTNTPTKATTNFVATTDAALGQGWTQRAIDAGLLVVNETSPKGSAFQVAGSFDPTTNQLTINLDKVPPRQTVVDVLLHEGSHAGLEVMLGDQFKGFHSDLLKLVDRGDPTAVLAIERATWGSIESINKHREKVGLEPFPHRVKDKTLPEGERKAELDRVRKLIDELNPRLLPEEDLAYYVQTASSTAPTSAGFWNRLKRALQAWFAGTDFGKALAGIGWRPELAPDLAVALAKAATRQTLARAEAANKLVGDRAAVLRGMSAGESAAYLDELGMMLESRNFDDDTWWRSGVKDAVASAPQNKAQPEQWLGWLKKQPGVKQEELDDLGLEDWLRVQEGVVTKQTVEQFVEDGGVQIGEDVLDAYGPVSPLNEDAETQYHNYTLPGGDNYRELLIRIPSPSGIQIDRLDEKYDQISTQLQKINNELRGSSWNSPVNDLDYISVYDIHITDGEAVESDSGQPVNVSDKEKALFLERDTLEKEERQIGETRAKLLTKQQNERYTSSHYDESNVLVHIRFDERTDAEGKRVLFVEEVQSDWHQEGRKRGYQEQLNKEQQQTETILGLLDSTEKAGVPNAPFKSSWPMLGMKRAIRWAAQNGFDKVAWTPGEVQADRYDLSKQVEWIHIGKHPFEGEGYWVEFKPKTGDSESQTKLTPKQLEQAVGKEITTSALEQLKTIETGEYANFEGDNLAVGGEGMKGFYDKMLPSMMKKYGKKFGARVETTQLSIPVLGAEDITEPNAQEVWSIPITPKLKEEALSGQLLYSFPPMKEWGDTKTWLTSPVSTYPEDYNVPGVFNKAFHGMVDRFDYVKGKSQDLYRAFDEWKNRQGALQQEIQRTYRDPMRHLVSQYRPPEGDAEPIERMKIASGNATKPLQVKYLKKQLAAGSISQADYNASLRDLELSNASPQAVGITNVEIAGHQLAARHILEDEVTEKLALKAAPKFLKELKEELTPYKTGKLNEAIKAITGGSIAIENLTNTQARQLFLDYLSGRKTDSKIATRWELYNRRSAGYSIAQSGSAAAKEDMADGFINAHDLYTKDVKNHKIFKQIGELSDQLAAHQLKLLQEGGLLEQSSVDRLSNAYKHYVPLRREAFDYDQELKEMFEKPVANVGKLMTREGSIELPSAVHVLQNHLASGFTAASAAARNQMMNKFADEIYKDVKGWKSWFYIKNERVHKNDVGFIRNGEPLYIVPAEGNLRAASIVKVIAGKDTQDLSGPLKVMRSINSWIRWSNVSASPAFLIPNTPRDYLTAVYNLQASDAKDYVKEIASWKAYKESFKALKKVMIEGVRESDDPQVQEWIDLVESFEKAGGKTSFVEGLRAMDGDSWKSFEAQVGRRQGKLGGVVEFGADQLERIENLNIVLENVMRLSTYKVMRDKYQTDPKFNGMTQLQAEERAAEIARNLTTNFTRRGAHIDAMNTWWVFYNATVQGNWQVIQNLFLNPNKAGQRKLQKAVAGTILFAFMIDQLGRAMSDDEDDDGISDWDSRPGYEKDRKISAPFSVGGVFPAIPAPWVFNVFWRLGGMLGEVKDGVMKPQDALLDTMGLVFTSMNPISGGTMAQAVAPSAFDPFMQIIENRNFVGNPLGPDGYPGSSTRPDAYLAWDSTPKGYKHVAEFINDVTGGSPVESGKMDFRPSSYKVLTDFALGSLGRTVVDLGKLGLTPVMDDLKFEGSEKVPGLKVFLTAPSDSTAISHYHDRVAKVLGAKRLTKMYSEGVDKDSEKLAEVQRDRAAVLRLVPQVEDTERQIKSLRKTLRAARARKDSRTEEMLRDRITKLQKRFNQSYNRRVGN